MGAAAVTAVHLYDLPVFQHHADGAGSIQLAAVTGEEFFLFHLQILSDAEAPGADGQEVLGHDFHVHAEVQPMGGDLPGVAAAVYITAESAALIGAGVAHMLVARLEELNKHCKALQENYRKTIALSDDMKQALLRKAFNGEL